MFDINNYNLFDASIKFPKTLDTTLDNMYIMRLMDSRGCEFQLIQWG